MLRRFVLTTAIAIAALLFTVVPASAAPPECNWGQLTQYAILELDFDQGAHSSDPSGDGRGKEDRVGLPNVVEKGNLDATCQLIESLLP